MMRRLKPWFKKALIAWAILVLPGYLMALSIDWKNAIVGYFIHISLDDPIDFVADIVWKAMVLFPFIGVWFGMEKSPPDDTSPGNT